MEIIIKRVKEFFLSKENLFGLGLFLYFFLLLLGVLIPPLRLGTSGGISIAFIYRAVIFIIFFAITIFLFYKKYHTINYILAIFILVFFVTNILAIFIAHGSVVISNQLKWMSVLYLSSIVFTVFAFFEVFNSYVTRKSVNVVFVLLIITALVCALYSDIAEFNSIINAFKAEGEDAHFYQIHSFFDNKNSYGLVLFVALVANIYLYLSHRNKYLAIPFIYLLLNLVISRSKTALIIVALFILTLFVYWLIKSWQSYKKRNIAIISTIAILFTLFMVIVFTPEIYNSSSFLTHLSNYVREAFIGQAIRSLEDRFNNLGLASEIFLTPRIIIGYGEHTCYSFANSCCYRLGYIDNSYIYNLLAGGIFKTALFVYCYYLIFKKVFELNKETVAPIYKIVVTSTVISTLLYGLMENYQILGSNHVSFIFLVYSVSIPTLLVKEVNDGK